MVSGEVKLFGMKSVATYDQITFNSHVYDNLYYLEPAKLRVAALTPERDGHTSAIVDAVALEDPRYWPITIVVFHIHSYEKRVPRHPRHRRTITHTTVYIEEYSGFRFAFINGITNSGWLYRLGIEAINILRSLSSDQIYGSWVEPTTPKLVPLDGDDLEDAKQEFLKHYDLIISQGRRSTTLTDLPKFLED